MRRALIVGIDDYPTQPLDGCVKDAHKMRDILEQHYNKTNNFDVTLLTSENCEISKDVLYDHIIELFKEPSDIALFYFSGHGTRNMLGGHLVTQDAQAGPKYHKGVGMTHLLELARKALKDKRIKEVILFLDCCNSGEAGNIQELEEGSALLTEGLSVLTASRSTQKAIEDEDGGILTSFLYDALNGGASDIRGNVTLPAIYSYVDQALGAWDQRPQLKLNVSKLTPIRYCKPKIDVSVLARIPEYFPEPNSDYILNTSYEFTEPDATEAHVAIFNEFKQLQLAGLLYLPDIDITEEKYRNSLYWAAKRSTPPCRLTALGQYYRKLVLEDKL